MVSWVLGCQSKFNILEPILVSLDFSSWSLSGMRFLLRRRGYPNHFNFKDFISKLGCFYTVFLLNSYRIWAVALMSCALAAEQRDSFAPLSDRNRTKELHRSLSWRSIGAGHWGREKQYINKPLQKSLLLTSTKYKLETFYLQHLIHFSP